ncbi:RICIN domain-containing protein [Streptomyces beihaiensis]|uniref:RICIN domain-containing protein n=1 Tax=Streptomyces beihaiensis TaxID=2984495 RepID=A0ABT3TNH9_9ACTN|nr:RICIN domain-containing protein [Streptomyces beihaiensis]MCX3058305.1 RICIN domain-containing protein [Streptomyces beihaiensis]
MQRFLHAARDRLLAVAAAASLVAAALSAGAFTSAPAATAATSATTSATVTVDTTHWLANYSSTTPGLNTQVYDANMNRSDIPGLLGGAGIGMMRYPGGSYADIYHWKTNTADGGVVAPNTDFDSFMATVRAAHTQPIITADYGSGTPQEAADWVRYANITKGYGVKYWEIGNEIPGNGEYGAQWETDLHSSHSATTYADNLLKFVSAMKAVDPTIKIGAVLTAPGRWPDGIVGPGDTQDWNHTVLSIAGSKIDFVIVHDYPTSTSEADLLTKPQTQIPSMARTVRSLINQYAGGNAPNVGIAITETNADRDKNTAPNGLFAPDQMLTWAENGAFTVDYWAMHNGTDCSHVTTVDGATDYGDGGVLSSGASCEPAVDTPFAPFHGISMISKLAQSGDSLIKTDSSTPLISAHAVHRGNGDVNVMLINKDPNNSTTVSLSYKGFTPSSATPTVYTYRKNGTSITSSTSGSATTQTVPAYSVVVVRMHPSSGGGTGALHAVGAGKCLDIDGGSTTAGTQAQIWDCDGGAAQRLTRTSAKEFRLYADTSTPMCLDDYGNGTTNGTAAVIWQCNGGANQQWNVNPNGTITNVRSGLCLDVNGYGTADGTKVQLWACGSNQSNQQWTFG